jgi:hypothetical protein
MPENRYAKLGPKIRELTNKELAPELAKLSKLSVDHINELLPTKKDKEAFALLMAQVEAEKTHDEQVAFLEENVQVVGGVIFRLLKALV